MKPFFISLALLVAQLTFSAQAQSNQPSVVRLWEQAVPGALGTEPKDIPTLTVYLPKPELATGAAMVVCPGGGYGGLAGHEGEGYAVWLNEHGIAAFVLKYRLGSSGYHHPCMIQDASRAIRMVRACAGEWKVDPKRVGIIGSSAGGHLASTAVTHFDAGDPNATDPIDKQSSRPNLGILCYPVITMGEFTHAGSRENLLGANPSPDLVRELSNELQVKKDTPPCFIWHTSDDTVVPVENSIQFASALRKAGIPFDLHIYEHGPHGLGLGKNNGQYHPWTADCLVWLKAQNFIK